MQPRTSAREIQLLNPSEAAQGEPVHLRGVVTVSGGWKDSFFLQDASGGIAVNMLPGAPELRPGDRVIVDGVTAAGDFAPVIADASIRIQGHGPLPVAPRMRLVDLDWGGQDSQWVEVEGEVRSVEHTDSLRRPVVRLLLNMGAGDPTPLRVVSPERDVNWEALIGATIRFRGVCATIWNKHRQFVGLRFLITSRANLSVIHPAPADPYDVPFRTIGGLVQYSRATGGSGQVAIQGSVTLVDAGQGFFLQDRTGAVFVASRQEQPALNSVVEVVGFPTVTPVGPAMQASRFQTLGNATTAPLPITNVSELLRSREDSEAMPDHGKLMQLTGLLVDFTPGLHDATLLLKSDGMFFRARVGMDGASVRWQRGSLLRLVGVCDGSLGHTEQTASFLLRLRSAHDVTVLRRAPWWSAVHAIWLSAALGAVALGMLGWVGFLRRQARLRRLVDTDPLTGLYNRRAFFLLAEKRIELMRRTGSALLLFYLDLDNFKHINDTHGHRAGDATLREVAALLRQAFRESDIICRMGGDEFAILASGAGPHTEDLLRGRLTEAVLSSNLRGQRPFRIALSMGTVSYDHACAERSVEDLLEHADALMYGNKRQRKDAKMVPLTV